MSISTVIVTPSVLLRQGIASLLQRTGYKVVASAARPTALSFTNDRSRPTLAIIGIDHLQNKKLDEVAESILLLRSLLPDAKFVLVAESEGAIKMDRILALSADACIFNLSSRDALIKVLELTLLGQGLFVFPKSITAIDFTDRPTVSQSDDPSRHVEINGDVKMNGHVEMDGHGLSPRERQVVACLAQGKSNKVIARFHQLSEATVKVHVKAILRKIKARNRTQAALWAVQHSYLDQPIVTDARKSQPMNGAGPLQSGPTFALSAPTP